MLSRKREVAPPAEGPPPPLLEGRASVLYMQSEKIRATLEVIGLTSPNPAPARLNPTNALDPDPPPCLYIMSRPAPASRPNVGAIQAPSESRRRQTRMEPTQPP